jgi:hypothetical protein
MSRYEITDDGKLILIECPDGRVEILRPTEPDVGVYLDDVVIAVIRQQQSEIAELTAERDQLREYVGLLTHKVICCGVAADHPDAGLTETGAYATKWNSAQAESVRKLRSERDQLLARLAAVDAAPASPNSKPR